MKILSEKKSRVSHYSSLESKKLNNFYPICLKFMKVSAACFLMLCVFTLSLWAKKGNAQSIYTEKISITTAEKSLDAVLTHIERLSHFHFVYKSDELKKQYVKEVKVKNITVGELLKQLLTPRNLSFKQIGDNVIIEKTERILSENKSLSSKAILISGTITDETGKVLPGVTVTVKESQGTTISGNDGKYRISAENKQTLIFSFVGFKRQERSINGSTNIDIVMISETNQLNDVVVVGYGTQNKRDVTTAISSLKSDQINNFPSTGVDKALTGKLAGVQILQPNGAPGAAISIAIRGKSTITAGSNPLYVIDGLPLSDNDVNGPGLGINPLNAINVNDIETVDVLKDASAAAIYGSRGSNGVIIITTKRGKRNKPVVSYNSHFGIQKRTKTIPMLDAYQYAKLIYDSHNNTYFDLLADKNLSGSASDDNATRLSKLGAAANSVSQSYLLPPEIFPYLNNQPGLINTNWQDAIFTNAPTQSHTLSITGGSDAVRYYVSSNYQDQQGIVIGSGYKKYAGRVNLDASYNRLKLGASINYLYANYQFQPTEGRFSSNENVVSGALTASPFFPVYNTDGSYNYNQYNWQYGQSQSVNPLALANLKSDLTGENKLLSNLFAEYSFTNELTNKVSFGIDVDNFSRNAYRPSTLPNVSPSTAVSIPTGNYRNTNLVNWVAENTLSFNKRFADHSIKAIAVVSAQKENRASSNVSATGFPNDLIKTLNGATSISSFSSQTEEWSLLSALSRVQYSFKDKYLLSAAIRTDGSSRFGPDSKYGFFPSASVGWNVDRENFMKSQSTISSLKLRGSYGVTGNFQIGNYAYLSLLSPSSYTFGAPGASTVLSGLYQSTPGNGDLSWEKTSSINLGTEIGLFKEKLNATIDVYSNNTTGLLLNVPVPQSSGFSSTIKNIGKVNNKGLEISLNSNNHLGGFKISNSANISFNRNKVLDLGGANSIITQAQGVIYFITQVGQPIGNYYTLVYDGIYKNTAELTDASTPKVPGAKVGDFKFKDQNGDGIIDGTNDRAISGNYQPKFTYGFSSQLQYKAFDLNVALQGVYGNKIANIHSRYINAIESFVNNTTDALNRFNSESDPGNGLVARANRNQRGLNATISTYHIEDGSYLRIRDITLGITLPEKFVERAGLSKLRFYITGTNLFTIAKYSLFNPEVSSESNPLTPGVDYGSYPLTKSIVFGLNLSL